MAKLQQTTLLFFNFYLSKKIRIDISCESSARQRIHMKYQILFSLENNEKIFKNVVSAFVIGALRVNSVYRN